jgi:glucose uptake protein
MILPSTYGSALLLLLLSFVCLGSWINTYKLTGTRWRFELYYVDFAIGALIVGAIAAFTLGSLGSDLAFSDRMLVAGRAAQAIVVGSGFIFNLGNMLLMAGVALIGMSTAFPLSGALGVLVSSCFLFRSNNVWLLSCAIVLLLITALVEAAAARSRAAALNRSAQAKAATASHESTSGSAIDGATQTVTMKRAARPPARAKMRRSTKGILLGVLGGIVLGLFYPVSSAYLNGEFGVGPYAGMLLFAIGVLLSTVVYNFYFLNIAIDGPPLGWGAYFRGNVQQHLLGFAGGALWAGGTLAAVVAKTVPASSGISPVLAFTLPLASVVLVVIWGTSIWKEFGGTTSQGKLLVFLGPTLFLAAVILIGFALE